MNIISSLPVKTKTGTPITTAEAKKQLEIESTFTADDTYIDTLVAAAIDKLEADTNSDVLETTNVLTFEVENSFQSYTVHQAPLISFTKMEKKVSGSWSDVAEADYQITHGFSKFDIEILTLFDADQIRITYKTGYVAANIPKVLKQAALLKVSDLFDSERQGYTLNVQANRAYEALINKHIRTYFG